MNDYKVTLSKKLKNYLSKKLPTGYSFQPYTVRNKNFNDYPYKQYDKKYRKAESIILSKKQSIKQSLEPSQQSFRQKSEQIQKGQNFKKIQEECINFLRKLRKHQSSQPFRTAVDPKALQIPDYFDIVFEPIDLKIIEQNIKRDQYAHFSQLERDVYKMIMNSYKYNQKTSSTYTKTIQFETFFRQALKDYLPNDIYNNVESSEIKMECQNQAKIGQVEIKYTSQAMEQQLPIIGNLFVEEMKEKSKPGKTIRQFQNLANPKYQKKQIPKKCDKALQSPVKLVSIPQSSQRYQIPIVLPQFKQQYKVKQQAIQSQQQQFDDPLASIAFSQAIQQQKQQKQEYINQQIKSYLQNQTHNNRDNNFSEGYNQSIYGYKISTNQVQKQISHLLKRLGQFPLTKIKKHKVMSKFNNLQQNMTQSDKKKLYSKLFDLKGNDINIVIQILTRGKHQITKNQQFQIDIDKVDTKILREIQNFIMIRDQNHGFQKDPAAINASSLAITDTQKTKKQKKQEKKLIKKKPSKKDFEDDSFSMNAPSLNRRKKSQKPLKKKHHSLQKGQDQNHQIHSNNDDKSSSSYKPQQIQSSQSQKPKQKPRVGKTIPSSRNINHPIYTGKTLPKPEPESSIITPYKTQTLNSTDNRKPSTRNIRQSDRYHSVIQDPQQFLSACLVQRNQHYQEQAHHNEQSVSLSVRSNRGTNGHGYVFAQLDSIDDHGYHLGMSARKGFGDEQLKQFSIMGEKQDDQDQFFNS